MSCLTKCDLHPYQIDLVEKCKASRKALILADMGLGKTVIMLTVISDVKPRRTLIVAPKIVAQTTWIDEVANWAHTRHLSIEYCGGTESMRHTVCQSDSDIMTIGSHNLAWLVKNYAAKWAFDFIVIDESSRIKNPTSKVSKAAHKIGANVPWIFCLTATPIPNGYHDIWSQVQAIDQGARLGRNVTQFRQAYFIKHHMGFGWNIRRNAQEEINAKIDDISHRLDADKYLPRDRPTIIDRHLRLPAAVQKDYDEFSREQFIEIEGEEIEAVNAAARVNKLRQFANGSVYTGDADGYVCAHEAKLDMVAQIIEEAQGKSILIGYEFKSDWERLQERFPNIQKLTSDKVTDWNNGKISLMAGHPQSAGHGLNLQQGGHILIWYTLPYSLENYEQMIGRLAAKVKSILF